MFKNAKYILLGVALVVGLNSFSQSNDKIDFTHLFLDLGFEPEKQKVNGELILSFDYNFKVDSIRLDAIRMDFSAVKLNGQKAAFHSDNKNIWISTSNAKEGKSNEISITYSCKPRKGIYFVGWDDETNTSPKQIWTQGQGIDHRHWIPHRDDQTDKLTTELSVHFDSEFEVISNGNLLEVKKEKSKKTWHYKMPAPHSSYLIMLAIGEYEKEVTSSESGIPLTQYYYKDREGDYEYYYKYNEKIFNFLEQEIGIPYPWKSYTQVPVMNFRHGAMENTTATIFGDFFLVDSIAFNDKNYTYVNAHELAHHWFGNLVTATQSDHHWLHEGFATYYQWLSEKNLYGEDFFDWMRYKEAQLVFQASLHDSIQLGSKDAGSSRFYQKGAWVLYMLHQNLGDKAYKAIIKDYLTKNSFDLVDLESLDQSIKNVEGISANDFFNRWVNHPGEPNLKVKGYTRNDSLFFDVKQLDETTISTFKDYSIPVQIYFEDGTELNAVIPVRDHEYTHSYKFQKNKKVKYWTVNPNMQILAQIEPHAPFVVARKQFQASSKLLDKYFAIRSMKNVELGEKKGFLIGIFEDSNLYYPLRGEALSQLIESEKEVNKYFQYAFNQNDVQLKKEAIKLITKEMDVDYDFSELLDEPSYELREMALGYSVDWKNPKKNKWLKKYDTDRYPGIPGRNVEVGVLLYRLILFKDRDALSQLKLRTTPAYDFMTRMNAMEALQAINYMDKELLDYYFLGMFDYNWKLVRTSRAALKSYYDTPEGKEMILDYVDDKKKSWDDFKKRNVNRNFDLNID